jgi:hypothetical protein
MRLGTGDRNGRCFAAGIVYRDTGGSIREGFTRNIWMRKESIAKMIDREKVVKGLECLARKKEPMANPCSKCDYHDRPNFAFCVVDVATDTLALLKEQEAEIRQLRLALDIAKGTCKGIVMKGQ